jgi:hypothetical protein
LRFKKRPFPDAICTEFPFSFGLVIFAQ